MACSKLAPVSMDTTDNEGLTDTKILKDFCQKMKHRKNNNLLASASELQGNGNQVPPTLLALLKTPKEYIDADSRLNGLTGLKRDKNMVTRIPLLIETYKNPPYNVDSIFNVRQEGNEQQYCVTLKPSWNKVNKHLNGDEASNELFEDFLKLVEYPETIKDFVQSAKKLIETSTHEDYKGRIADKPENACFWVDYIIDIGIDPKGKIWILVVWEPVWLSESFLQLYYPTLLDKFKADQVEAEQNSSQSNLETKSEGEEISEGNESAGLSSDASDIEGANENETDSENDTDQSDYELPNALNEMLVGASDWKARWPEPLRTADGRTIPEMLIRDIKRASKRYSKSKPSAASKASKISNTPNSTKTHSKTTQKLHNAGTSSLSSSTASSNETPIEKPFGKVEEKFSQSNETLTTVASSSSAELQIKEDKAENGNGNDSEGENYQEETAHQIELPHTEQIANDDVIINESNEPFNDYETGLDIENNLLSGESATNLDSMTDQSVFASSHLDFSLADPETTPPKSHSPYDENFIVESTQRDPSIKEAVDKVWAQKNELALAIETLNAINNNGKRSDSLPEEANKRPKPF